MPRRGLVLCSSLFFIVLLMCPKRIRPAAPERQKYIHAVKKSPNALTDISAHIRRTDWVNKQLMSIIQLDGKPLKDVQDEPGSVFTEDQIKKFKLWPKGIIPYYINPEDFPDKVLRDRIRLFLNTVNSLTMLRFVELPNKPAKRTRYVHFHYDRNQMVCMNLYSIGFDIAPVPKYIGFGYNCLSSGHGLAAAVLAVAGVPPQHISPDRDNYITIVDDNIIKAYKHRFKKLKETEWPFQLNFYDYRSAGHFDYHSFSKNGKATIEVKDTSGNHTLGKNNKFSKTDIKKLRVLYNYIVKKDMDVLPDCAKLFRIGDNFQKNGTVKNELPKV